MKRLLIIILFLLFAVAAKAQIAIDTLSAEALNELLIEQVERMAEDSDDDIDYEELLDNYIFLSDNPINLNSDDMVQLMELHLINAFQYEELKKYRRYYGDFMFLDELAMVEGFDEQTIEIIRPLVCVGQDNGKDKITFKKMARYGKHQILGRYEQVLEKQQGYLPITDSALLAKPNSRYLGCPQKLQFRYTYNYRNRIRAGIVVEKDAGEMFFTDKVSDTIKALLGKKYSRGFDFIGFHLYAKDLGIMKAAVLRDETSTWHLAQEFSQRICFHAWCRRHPRQRSLQRHGVLLQPLGGCQHQHCRHLGQRSRIYQQPAGNGLPPHHWRIA